LLLGRPPIADRRSPTAGGLQYRVGAAGNPINADPVARTQIASRGSAGPSLGPEEGVLPRGVLPPPEPQPERGTDMVTWHELSRDQKAVLDNAIDEGDLPGLLWLADARWTEADLGGLITRLSGAILDLLDRGLLELYPSSPAGAPALRRDEVDEVLANPKAWWNGDVGVEVVVWLVLTDAGSRLLSTVSAEDWRVYRGR
jgi:hypothetical protein